MTHAMGKLKVYEEADGGFAIHSDIAGHLAVVAPASHAEGTARMMAGAGAELECLTNSLAAAIWHLQGDDASQSYVLGLLEAAGKKAEAFLMKC